MVASHDGSKMTNINQFKNRPCRKEGHTLNLFFLLPFFRNMDSEFHPMIGLHPSAPIHLVIPQPSQLTPIKQLSTLPYHASHSKILTTRSKLESFAQLTPIFLQVLHSLFELGFGTSRRRPNLHLDMLNIIISIGIQDRREVPRGVSPIDKRPESSLRYLINYT